jgi:RNA polymerase sigma-70 factor (ECF subfamily)
VTIPFAAEPVELARKNPEPSGKEWAIYGEGVRFIAERALGDPAAADDIAQEAVLRAMNAVADKARRRIEDIPAFIHGIARHLIADALRERGRYFAHDSRDVLREEDTPALETIVSAETRARVVHLVAKLARSDRELLIMSFERGMSSREIARELGESAENIRKRKSRLLERLRVNFGSE